MNNDFLKLTSYFGERHRSDGRLLADALIDLFAGQSVATSILLRGMMGFGLKQHLRTDRLLTLSEDLPLVAVAVDERQRIQSLAEEVLALKRSGLVTLERAQLLSATSERLTTPARPGEGTKLTIYLGRQERVEDTPAFVAVCELLRRRGAQSAVVVLGVDGTAHGVRHRARFLSRNANVPLMLIAIAQDEQIAELVPDLGRVLRRPLMTLERVRVCKRDGQLLARPPVLAQTDERGLAVWQKLMVYSSEESQHHGEPQHRMIVRRLREQGLRGATVLRGVWGFHGEHEPRGDRLLQLRRRVPVVTIAIDAPPRIARAFAVIDEITDETGLVTSEIVPALTALTPDERRGGVRLARRLP